MDSDSKPPRAGSGKRRSIRLGGYDYAQVGGYFVTLCTHRRRSLFGEIVHAEMKLNSIGKIAEAEWLRSAELRAEIVLDEFVVMPNHLHGIVLIREKPEVAAAGATGRSPLRPTGPVRRSLGALVAGFKAAMTRMLRDGEVIGCSPLWQRGYYEHVIRDERDLDRIRQYIADNPRRWAEDSDNPANIA